MKLQRVKLFSLCCVHAAFDDNNILHLSIPISYKGFSVGNTLNLTISETLEITFDAKVGYLKSEKVDILIEQVIRYSRYCMGTKRRLEAVWERILGVPLEEYTKRECDYLGLLFACSNQPSLADFTSDPTTLIALYDVHCIAPDELIKFVQLKRTEIIYRSFLRWKAEDSDSVDSMIEIPMLKKSQYRFMQNLRFEHVRYGRKPHCHCNAVVLDLFRILSNPKLNCIFNGCEIIDVKGLPTIAKFLEFPNAELLNLSMDDMVEVASKKIWSSLILDIDRMLNDINVAPKYRLKDIRQLADIKRVHDGLVAELNRINAANQLFGGNVEMMEVSFPQPPVIQTTGIQWLETPAALINEGIKMQHCIGSSYYCQKAIKGEAAYFHVEYKEQCATLELCLRKFRLLQLQGVRNSIPSDDLAKLVEQWLIELKYKGQS